MSIENVRNILKKFNMENNIIEFNESTATVELAAKALKCEENKIAKTLAMKVKENAILIVVAGDAKIDNKKYKEKFGIKAKMLTPEETLETTGFKIGGVCPFINNENVKIYLDESLKRFEIIYPAAGTSNSAVKLTINELEKYSSFEEWIDVCKINNILCL